MLRFGLVGCGRISDLHVPVYRTDAGACLHAICDRDPALLARRSAEWGVERTYSEYQALLDDPEIDAVEIVTPHHLHRDMCLAACRAGKHISVQKPMALTLAECDEMIAGARAAGVQLKVFENFIFYPPYVKARQLIREGAIGEPLAIRLKLGSGRGGWKIPLAAWLWRLSDAGGGGGLTVLDDGYHKFSLALFFLGPVARVHAWIDRTYGVVDAPAMISWAHRGGAVGLFEATISPHLHLRTRYYPADDRVEISGSEGRIYVSRCTGQLLDEPVLVLERHGRLQTFDDLRSDWLDSFIDSGRQFFDVLRGEGQPVLSGEQGREVLRFALAAQESARTGEEVVLDDDEA